VRGTGLNIIDTGAYRKRGWWSTKKEKEKEDVDGMVGFEPVSGACTATTTTTPPRSISGSSE